MTVTISRTDLARNTREVIEQVRKGEIVVVQSYGEAQVVLLDAMDYQLLKAMAGLSHDSEQQGDQDPAASALQRYLTKQISLAKAAELLGTNRFELMERFDRLNIPIRNAPATVADVIEEVDTTLSLIPIKS